MLERIEGDPWMGAGILQIVKPRVGRKAKQRNSEFMCTPDEKRR